MTGRQSELPGLAPNQCKEDEDFDWKGPDVIIQTQPGTAIYRNVHQAVVIRQEAMNGDDDQFVFFATADDVRTLITALQREIGDA
ncbi:hypothetical protein [Rhizobium bangladeshense]|uniref:hypothetical protein n=1 Tax=Rhizobium bangladeshense TaxID=1138189 RepID=UPI001A991426|nr:hypothetical protein [Rhizobium bangladeshense]MBX4884071.1 hypothetical protein [Rhizobium bangladeshense]MBX4931300.1 hypothetical protein [Rhizobium bangladeshense]QSY90348.1 hypothetical protein J2J98_09600 [Rhizobium bangladeshense]